MISNEERAFQVLLKLGGAGTSDEIAHECGWTQGRGSRGVGQIMTRLISEGKVERLGTGIYRIKQRLHQSLK